MLHEAGSRAEFSQWGPIRSRCNPTYTCEVHGVPWKPPAPVLDSDDEHPFPYASEQRTLETQCTPQQHPRNTCCTPKTFQTRPRATPPILISPSRMVPHHSR